MTLRNSSTGEEIKDIKDLVLVYNSNKPLGVCFMLLLFSGIGMPPLMGFYSKYMVFVMLVQSGSYVYTGVVILLNVIGSLYYLWLIASILNSKTDKQICLKDIGAFKAFVIALMVILNIIFIIFAEHFIIKITLIILSTF